MALIEPNHQKIGRILIVDDECELMSALCEMLADQGYETAGFLTGAEALAVLKDREFDLLLTDLMMTGMDGIELIQAGLAIDPNLMGIIMTGHGTVRTAVAAMKTGAFDYILKPFKLDFLMPLLSRAMQVRNLRLENMQLKETVAIHELGKAIAFSFDTNAIMNKIADTALQQCSADEVSIMLPTQDGRDLYVAVVRGGQGECLGAQAPIEQGIAGWVARNREPVVLRGEVNDPRMAPIRPRADIHTAVSMPLLSGGNLLGVLNVNITKSHRQFTLGQLKALSILISIIAPVLENTWLNIKVRNAEEKYRSIFENAIEGIFQQSPDGRLIAANPSVARVFGYDSPEDLIANATTFVRQVYVDPDRGAEFVRLMDTNGEVRNFDYQARRKDGSQVWISISAHAVRDEKGVLLYYEGMSEDVTERKLSEAKLKLAKEILETLNRPNGIQKLIDDILRLLKENTGFEAIGIRLKEGEDYPYFVSTGLTSHFLEAENYLCARDAAGEIIRDAEGNPYLEGKCGNVLCGQTDPSLPFFTEHGSFWTNSTTKRLAETPANETQVRIRNRCNREGYESLALIPLRSGEEIIGLLQLSDSRQNLFTLDMIRFFEGIGASIGIAVARRQSAEELQEREEWLIRERSMVDRIMKTSPAGITVVNRDEKIVFANKRAREILKLTLDKITGLTYEPPEWRMTDFDGAPVLPANLPFLQVISAGLPIHGIRQVIVSPDGQQVYLSINGAPIFDEQGNINEVVFTIDDITKQRRAEEKISETIGKLRQSINDTIRVIAMITETRDPYTTGHQERVASLAAAIAAEVNLSAEQIEGIRMAAIVHDIGKIKVPAEILSKPGKLSLAEFGLIKTHAEIGYKILETIDFPYPVANIVYQHHERIDGSGYPRQLSGDEIVIEARILAVADIVEAIASHRPYRAALGIDAALQEIEKNSGILYDPAITDACLRLFREKGFQFV